MKILFVTNTFTPHVGGVARSIETFTRQLRIQGVEVFTVAPSFENMPDSEQNVLRVPAVQNFNGSDFSVAYPLTGAVSDAVEGFRPDVIHSHHPFLLGVTALRIARADRTPIVFTHHTMYEQYTHYVPGDSDAMKRFVIELGTVYANMCSHVIAPSESIRDVLKNRGVTTPVSVVPTGVDCEKFTEGSGSGFRRIMGIPDDTFLVGHVGRLALEKNLVFLAKAVVEFLRSHPSAHFLLVGNGAHEKLVLSALRKEGVDDRVHWPGSLTGRFLTSAYLAMDVFAFASHSETQGMVLTEAMAAGVPVVAVDAPGVREVVISGKNGLLLDEDSTTGFVEALHTIATTRESEPGSFRQGCQATSEACSIQNCTRKLIGIYECLIEEKQGPGDSDYTALDRVMRVVEAEWEIVKGVAAAAGNALLES